MLANSFAGALGVGGRKSATLIRVTGSTYDTTTCDNVPTTDPVALERVRVRQVRASDRRWVGAALIEKTERVVRILAVSLPPGVAPTAVDQLLLVGRTHEILTVATNEYGGRPVSYDLALAQGA